MVKPSDRFNKLTRKYENDPEYVAEGLLIDINEQIVRMLTSKEITRTRLAKMLDVSTAYITKLLNGNENLTIKQLVRLAVALDCCVDVAFVPRLFTVNRLLNYTPKTFDMQRIGEPISLEESDEPNLTIAA